MILIPNFGRKHAAAIFLGAAAVTATVLAVEQGGPLYAPSGRPAARPAETAPTLAAYQAAAREAASGFVPNDGAAAAGAISRLMDLRVPAEGRAGHFALVAALTAYRQALDSGDPAAAASSLERLKGWARDNPWIGIVID